MSDYMKYDGRSPEPPYECPSCAAKDAEIAALEKVRAVVEDEEVADVLRASVTATSLVWNKKLHGIADALDAALRELEGAGR